MRLENYKIGMRLLKSVFQNLKPTAEDHRVWFALLNDIPDEQFLKAVYSVCQLKQSINSWDNIVALLREESEKFAPHGVNTPESAWGEVMEAIRKYGIWQEPEFSSDSILYAVRAIGWETLCKSDMSQTSVHRAHFFRIYSVVKARKREQAISDKLTQLLGNTVGELGGVHRMVEGKFEEVDDEDN